MTCSKKAVKLIYDSFVSSIDSLPDKLYQKWKTILRITIFQDNFLEYFAAIYSCVSAKKLREFQYKILHSTLTTNAKLFEWGMLENDRCTFCHNFTKILLHLLLECEASRGLRNDIAGYLAILCNYRIETSDVDITLGIVISEDFHMLLNFMNTVIKYYIFTCRSNNKHPTVPSAIWKIKDLCNIANSIAVKKCYLDQHNRKSCWTPCCNCALMSHDIFLFPHYKCVTTVAVDVPASRGVGIWANTTVTWYGIWCAFLTFAYPVIHIQVYKTSYPTRRHARGGRKDQHFRPVWFVEKRQWFRGKKVGNQFKQCVVWRYYQSFIIC